jgi:hypothetical protein
MDYSVKSCEHLPAHSDYTDVLGIVNSNLCAILEIIGENRDEQRLNIVVRPYWQHRTIKERTTAEWVTKAPTRQQMAVLG